MPNLRAHGEPLSFAHFASVHPNVDGYLTLDHVGTARTQQVRRTLLVFAEVAVHLVAPVLMAACRRRSLLPSTHENRESQEIFPNRKAKTDNSINVRSGFILQSVVYSLGLALKDIGP
jgi:hypothetical protein